MAPRDPDAPEPASPRQETAEAPEPPGTASGPSEAPRGLLGANERVRWPPPDATPWSAPSGLPLSPAPWEAPSGLPPVGHDAPPPPEGPRARYHPGPLLGRGGMGEVRRAQDPTLGRDVALKVPLRPGDDGRLLQEARLTARLQHPAILPVYDAGVTAEGRTFYTTPVFEGATLADALRARPPGRPALVRHLAAVAHALSYAHAQGVLHRDLKPGNVLLGRYGETVVTDWGLAVDAAGAVADGAGTPGFLAPEATPGAPIDGGVDVYAVGAMLRVGLDAAPGPRSPELDAIADRATAPRGARYADMSALAADLDAWLEGNRVSAYDYSAADVVRRWLWRRRAAVSVGVVGAALFAGAVGVGWARASAERDRAVVAEAASQRQLGAALLRAGRDAADAGRPVQARALALGAHAASPSPSTVGLLTRVLGRASPTRGPAAELPTCLLITLDRTGENAACQTADDLLWITLDPAPSVRGRLGRPVTVSAVRRDGSAIDAVIDDDQLWTWDGAAVTHTAAAGGNVSGVVPAYTGAVAVLATEVTWLGRDDAPTTPSCAGASDAVGAPDGAVYVSCGDGRVQRLAPGGEATTVTTLSAVGGGPSALDVSDDGALWLGTFDGWIQRIAPDGTATRARVSRGAVRNLTADPRGAAATTDDDTLTAVLTTPGGGLEPALTVRGPVLVAAWRGSELRVAGREVTDWTVPSPTWPATIDVAAGVAALSVADDGSWVVVGLGDGEVRVLDPRSGAALGPTRRLPFPVKDFAAGPDGALRVAIAGDGPQPTLRPPDVWSGPWSTTAARRLFWTEQGFVGTPYSGGVALWSADGAWKALTEAGDVWEADGDGHQVIVLARDGEVSRVVGGAVVPVAARPAARAVAALAEDAVIAGAGFAERVGPDGATRWRVDLDGDAVEARAARTAGLIAFGFRDGRVELREAATGALVAALVGHHARLSVARFFDGDRRLVTGSWDGTVRNWWLGDLELTSAEAADAPAPMSLDVALATASP